MTLDELMRLWREEGRPITYADLVALPKPEEAAWIVREESGKLVCVCLDPCSADVWRDSGKVIIPLYTAPPIQSAQGWQPNWPVMGYDRVAIGGGKQP